MNIKIIIIIKVLNNLILDKINKYNLNHKILQSKAFQIIWYYNCNNNISFEI